MSDLVCTRVRRSRFIDRDIVFNIKMDEHGMGHEVSCQLRKEMMDLGLAFFRNRVELRFTIPQDRRNSSEWTDVKEKIKDFCDSRCSGHWTWKYRSRNGKDNARIELDLMFEKNEELEMFLKDHGTIVRLTY